jgi:hypothetical protein
MANLARRFTFACPEPSVQNLKLVTDTAGAVVNLRRTCFSKELVAAVTGLADRVPESVAAESIERNEMPVCVADSVAALVLV